jgi:hypothetical protein
MNKSPANRFEAFIVPASKRKLDELQQNNGFKQGALVSRLVLSVTEDDIDNFYPKQKLLVDTNISIQAHNHWLALESKFGRRASKSKLIEIALSKLSDGTP